MINLTKVIRFLLFCAFFCIGAGSIVLSMLIEPEIVNYYQSRINLEKSLDENARIVSLTEQYQSQIALIESEPNVLTRFATVELGQKPSLNTDTVYPEIKNMDLLEQAESILTDIETPLPRTNVPDWVNRTKEPKNRKALFMAGAGLVLVSFIFFGTTRENDKSPDPQ